VDLAGWTVQYASAGGSTWSSTALSGTIQPHKYFLVQEAAGAGGSLALPTPDAAGGISMSATAGKVVLVNNSTALTGTCPSGGSIEDLLGYGAASCSETSPAPVLSNTTAELRHGGGCVDTDDNSADFSSGAPNPRNSAASANNCTFTLAVNIDPAATGTVAKAPDLASYTAGANVQLTATPADGYHFDHWSGGATGSSTPLGVTVNTDLVVTAHFLPNAFASQMVISQLYGGGGNAGATLTNDYIELYNRGNAPANITGWTVQYASASGNVWSTTTLIGTVPPGHYYLIQQSSGGAGTTGLPAADAIGTLNLGSTDGKLALVNNNVVLTGACPSGGTIVDMLGYGTADCSESSPAAPMSNTLSTFRNHDGCDETNDNLADFSNGVPSPRNSASPAHICDLWLGVGPRPTELVFTSPRPNPSHGVSSVSLALPAEARVRLTVTDVMGRRIASLVDGVLPAGRHEVSWSGVGDGGAVRSGLYYMTLEVSGRRIVRSFVLTR
jgi:predicted extracellular nuclease